MIESAEIKAGRFSYDPASKKVKPLPDKGLLRLVHNNSDERILYWSRIGADSEFECYLFPGDAVFEMLQQQNALLLKFTSYDEKHFFWFQDPKRENWGQFVKRANIIVNQEFIPKQEQVSIPPRVVPPSPEPLLPIPQPVAPQPRFRSRQEMEAYLKKLVESTPKVQDLLGEELIEVLQQSPDTLLQHLPEGSQTVEGLVQNLRSAQFRQGVNNFDNALMESQAVIMQEMGLDLTVLNDSFYHDAFWKALLKLDPKK